MIRTPALSAALATALFGVLPAFATPGNGNGPPSNPPGKEVLVINTPAQAVPVVTQGVTAIQGSVEVTNTPNVNVVNTPTVKAAQDGSWAVSILGSPLVGIDAAANQVRVANPSTAPVLVRNVDDARQPWATETTILCHAGSVCAGLQVYASFTVPAGKIYVIESLSVRAELSNGQRGFVAVLSSLPGQGDHRNWMPLTYQGTMLSPTMSMPDADMHVGSSSTRIYHDTDFPLNALLFRSDTRDLQVLFSVSGYLVDKP